MGMTVALAADSISKSYGDVRALDDVSLSVEEGEVLTLVGPNGAGKTTLVRILTGTVSPTAGTTRIFDQSPDDVDRSRIGVLPQAFTPFERLTVRELLSYYAGLYDETLDPDTVLEEVGLGGAGDTRYENLSGGQQRRTCLGIALINEPEVLVLDEPTTGIDPAGRRTVRKHILDLADQGTTVLVTTHDMDEAERLADRVALLSNGSIKAVDDPDRLIDEHAGPERLEVTTPSTDACTSAASALAEAGYDVTSDETVVVVRGIDATDIGAVAETITDIEYDRLAWKQPGLEDAYLTLAGDEETGRYGDMR